VGQARNEKRFKLLAGERNLGAVQQSARQTHAPLTEAEWARIKAEGTFLGEPLACQKAYGLFDLIHRNKALRNAIVPACAAKVLIGFLQPSSCAESI